MDEPISRAAVEDLIMKTDPWWCEGMTRAIFEGVKRLPTIEPKRGKWVERGENDDGTHNIQCSACDAGYKSRGHANSINTKQRFHFCPNCGADMRERSEE